MEAYKHTEMYKNEFPLKEIQRAGRKRNDSGKFTLIGGSILALGLALGGLAYQNKTQVPAEAYLPTVENVILDNHLRPEDLTIRGEGSLDMRVELDSFYSHGNSFVLEGKVNGMNERIVLEYTPVLYGQR